MKRVGVYIDGHNVYHGGLKHFKDSDEHWKWLDYRSLANQLLVESPWDEASFDIDRILYFTATSHFSEQAIRQRLYLDALIDSGSVSEVVYGKFVSRFTSVRVASPRGRGRLELFKASSAEPPEIDMLAKHLPIQVKPSLEMDGSYSFVIGSERIEEKGSDVNLASRLLVDVLKGRVDAAIVVTNDSDLALPLNEVREHVNVALINPRGKYLAGELRFDNTQGVGGHWSTRLVKSHFTQNQLADVTRRPKDW